MDKLKLLTLSLVGLGTAQHDKGQEGLISLISKRIKPLAV